MFAGTVLAEENEEAKTPVTIRNSTGMDVIYISVKDAAQAAFGDNLLKEGEVIEDGAEKELFFDTAEKEQPLLLGIMFDEEPRVQAIMHAFPFDGEEPAAYELLIAETDGVFPGDAVAYVREVSEEEDAFDTQEEEITAYKENQAMYFLPDPASAQGKNADEGCIGEEGLFN